MTANKCLSGYVKRTFNSWHFSEELSSDVSSRLMHNSPVTAIRLSYRGILTLKMFEANGELANIRVHQDLDMCKEKVQCRHGAGISIVSKLEIPSLVRFFKQIDPDMGPLSRNTGE